MNVKWVVMNFVYVVVVKNINSVMGKLIKLVLFY